MKIIGLTGESGTGKSTIAAHLEKRGAGHIDADRIGHDLLESDTTVRNKILRYFGPDVFTPEGGVDRKRLGEMVFKDGELLKVLNSILHPPIIEACVGRVGEFRRAGTKFVVVDAALLLEVELPIHLDLTIALRCDREEQVQRLRAKGGLTEEEIRSRLRSQAHLERSYSKADVVLDTSEELAQVLAELDAIIEEVLQEES